MGIYLPNVEMPQGNETITVQICPDGSIWQQYRGTVPNAKAVPVPPHGDLMDRKAVEELALWVQHTDDDKIIWLSDLNEVPVVIPAEE